MAKDSSSSEAKAPQSAGFAKVQDPNGPDQLDANNTGRVGDAREYDSLRPVSTQAEGFAAGQVAPETRYLTMDGRVVTEANAGQDGFRGSILVAKGSVVTAAQAAQLNG